MRGIEGDSWLLKIARSNILPRAPRANYWRLHHRHQAGPDHPQIASGGPVILRILILFSFLARHHPFTWTSSKLQSGFFVVVSCFTLLWRPYKQNFRNNVDIFMLGLLALSLTFLTETNYPGSNSSTSSLLLTTLLLSVPHMVLIFYICYMLSKPESRHNSVAQKQLQNIEKMCAGYHAINWRQVWRLSLVLAPCQTGC